MNALTIQTLFLSYSAFSFLAAILIAALFWNKNDQSAKIWVTGCLLTSIGTVITVQRDVIPLISSYSLMVSLETLSILLFSESLKRLSKKSATVSFNTITWMLPTALFLSNELSRYLSGGAITSITAITTSGNRS